MLEDLDKMALCEYTLSIKKIFNKYIMSYQTKTIPLSQIISSTDASMNSNNYQGFPSYQGNDNTNLLSKPNPLGYQEDGEDLSNKCVATYIDFNTDTSINTLSNYGITQNPNAIQVLCVGAGGGKGGHGGYGNVNTINHGGQKTLGGDGANGTSGATNIEVTTNIFQPPSINTTWNIVIGTAGPQGPDGANASHYANNNDYNQHGNPGSTGSSGNSSVFSIGNYSISGVGGYGGNGGSTHFNGGSFNNDDGTTPDPGAPPAPTPNISNIPSYYYPPIPNNVGGPGQNGFVRIYFKY